MRATLAIACLCLFGCKKEPVAPATPPAAKGPTVVAAEGTLHAVRCGPVTAEWLGEAPPAPAPKSYGVTALRFRLADGKVRAFEPVGGLEFTDWSFDVFSADCARVSLLQDRFGPFHVVKTDALAAYLEGGGPEAIIEKKGEGSAMVHSDFKWLTNDRFEFFASCCGGVEVYRVSMATPGTLERTFFAGQAPSGVARLADGGWEARP